MYKKYSAVPLFTTAFLVAFSARVMAIDLSSGVANSVLVNGSTQDGAVLCASADRGNIPCDREYDPNMIGVVARNAAVSIDNQKHLDGYEQILSVGKTYVLVDPKFGSVVVGDYLTSSKQAGLAKKALKSGYVIGTALENFDASSGQPGLVLTAISVRPVVLSKGAGDNLIEIIREGVDGAFLSPLSALRYVVASIIVISTIVFGFLHFGRVARSGVEAIGRNPLASASIRAGMLMNVFMSLLVVVVGVIVAYLVLVI